MPDLAWRAVTGPLLSGLILSFALELLLQPRPSPCWRRPFPALLTHVGSWLALYSSLMPLLRRPWFASAVLLAALLLVILVSNAKYRSLREPFIFQDFSYFVDAVRFPRLYLPFLGFWPGVAIMLAIGGAVAGGLLLEPPLPLASACVTAAASLAAGTGLLLIGHGNHMPLSLEPSDDLISLGLVAALQQYAREERKPWQGKGVSCFEHVPSVSALRLPNLVVIQSESFFDPRRWISGINPELLGNFDETRDESLMHGPLQVPAWGANTVRTEFSFLSGIANDRLGIHRFKPYRRVARQGLPSLASHMKRLGYRTVCLHPYSSGFYGRNELFPLLGFDEFIDISRFSSADYEGQYVGDSAVAREICAELSLHESSDARPLFLFAITMENHGPLHLEKPRAEDGSRFYSTLPPEGCDDLTAYLRHLEQADRMLGTVRNRLAVMGLEGWLCLYGDHLPIMAQVYRQLGEPDGTVDYLVWNNRRQETNPAAPQAVEQLPEALLRLMGEGIGETERSQPDASVRPQHGK